MEARGARGSGALALAALLAVFAWHVARTNFLIDDAYISFRYARNWAELGVPAYNPGGAPVEGYSNFLWTFLLRWCHAAGLDLEAASRVLSVVCGAALVVLVHRFLARELALSRTAAFLGTLLLVTFPPFATWTTGGLESALHALCAFSALALLLRRDPPRGELVTGLVAGAWGLALALARVEGVAWAAVIGFAAWLGARAAGRGLRARLVAYAVPCVLGFGAFLLWRHSVYGEWTPNTMHAKAGFSWSVAWRGAQTVATYGLLFVTPVVAVLLAPLLARRAERADAAVAFAGFFVVTLGYNVAVGGDWMPMFRFLAPASPGLAVLLAIGLERVARRSERAAWTLAVPAAVLQLLPVFDVHLSPRAWREALYFRTFQVGYETEWQRWNRGNQNREAFARVGRALAQIAEPGDSIVLGPIGAIGWFSGIVIHDRNGLVDREVARREAELGEGTAGHDKRVPRTWFLPRDPTWLQAAVWVPPPLGSGYPGLVAAARWLAVLVLQEPGDEGLFEHVLPEEHVLAADDDLPEGSVLVVLRRTDDLERARRFWSRVPAPRPGPRPPREE